MDDTRAGTCGACGQPIPAPEGFCSACGTPKSTPPTKPGPVPPARAVGSTDATGGIIPYKNAPALVAYYCGVFSVLPLFPIGMTAFVLGVIGLRRHRREPAVRGRVHAWIGILVGGFFGLIWTIATFGLVGSKLTNTGPGAAPRPVVQPQAPKDVLAALKPPSKGGAVAGSVIYANSSKVKPVNLSSIRTLEDHITAYTDELVVNPDGTLSNVMVYVKQGLEGQAFPVPPQPVVMNATVIDFYPHVLAVQINREVQFRNCDTEPHHWRTRSKRNVSMSFGQPRAGMASMRTFTAPEVPIVISSDIYPYMKAYICVVDNPYYNVTGPGGVFRLDGLPPGTYVIESWHEKLGRTQQTVTISEGRTTRITIKY